MENFIYKYYIEPIWSHTGYNVVNTLTYALIALVAVYALHRLLKNRLRFDEGFLKGVLPFVLFGSTVRVVTDSIDAGVFQPVSPFHKMVLDSHIYDYGYMTVSPGIYIITALLLMVSVAVLYHFKRMDRLWLIGTVLWAPHFLLLMPFMGYAIYAIPILLLACIPAFLAYRHFKDRVFAGIVGAQALDGAATFFAIDFFGPMTGVRYFEQHVFSAAIGSIGDTYFTFYLLKTAIAFAAAHVLMKEKMELEDKYFVALVLMIMGFAPGIRDILRMVVGA